MVTAADPAQIVINEIMYHPPGDLEDLQYLEVCNAGQTEVDLSGWSFSKGVKFVFSQKTRLASGAFLVICRDRMAFVKHYGEDVPLAGEFGGRLGHGGERVELADLRKKIVDAVSYTDAAPWPTAADGHSSSLERICPSAPGDDAANWAASNLPEIETAGGTPGRVNDSFSINLPPVISGITLTPASPAPKQPVRVEALIADADAVKGVEVTFQVATANTLSEAQTLPMKRVSGDDYSGKYQATLPAQPEGQLVRYRLKAIDKMDTARTSPPANDLRGAWSYCTFANTNSAKVPFGFLLHPGTAPTRVNQRGFRAPGPKLSRGKDAFIYLPPGGAEVQTFDFVQAPTRKGGYKVHFLKDQTLRGMTAINIIFEGSPRYPLSEALSYELYRLAGVPAEMTEHIRLSVDGQPRGYYLLLEQPNKSFLTRHGRDTSGNLYKLIWYGRGVIGMHEKKTNLTSGHGDLLALIKGLEETNAEAQWAFIEKQFNVEEFINYYAVNMCLQNWDGFHNNYFIYHDTGGSDRWEIYPWDEDKTWGDYDGASPAYNWYELPMNFGMIGSERPAEFGGPTKGNSYVGWWRAPGIFGGPLLANPHFRERFLVRLREVCMTIFTEEKVFPLISALESRLASEVPVRAQIDHETADRAMARFRSDVQSLRNQVIHRRKFILEELDKTPR